MRDNFPSFRLSSERRPRTGPSEPAMRRRGKLAVQRGLSELLAERSQTIRQRSLSHCLSTRTVFERFLGKGSRRVYTLAWETGRGGRGCCDGWRIQKQNDTEREEMADCISIHTASFEPPTEVDDRLLAPIQKRAGGNGRGGRSKCASYGLADPQNNDTNADLRRCCRW